MHPKQICMDIESMGAKLFLVGDDLYIENHMAIYPEIEQLIKDYKLRVIQYLKGEYSDKTHAVKQTIDKVIYYMRGVDQDMNPKIEDWLNHDVKAMADVLQLTIDLSHNGWDDCKRTFANYETVKTDKLSQEIFDRAMHYFKKGVTA